MKVGDKYWQAELDINGRPQDADDNPIRETAAEASMDAWEAFHSLSSREQKNAEACGCEWEVTAIADDGTIDAAESTGRYISMSSCGDAYIGG